MLFVGQDMSARDDGRYYSDDTSYADSGAHQFINKRAKIARKYRKVLVEGRLFVYLKTFEQFIAQNPLVEYRNLARTGVKINGAPYQTYDEAIGWISDSNSKILTLQSQNFLLIKEIADLKTFYHHCLNTLRIFYRTCFQLQ